MAVKLALVKRRSSLSQWFFQGVLLMVAAGTISACRPSPPSPSETLKPAPPAPADSAPETTAAQPTAPPTQTPAAPSNTPTVTLPDTLIQEWQPLSNVLVAFGTMTVTPDRVQWSSGQSSSYSLISTEGGYLLELESSPSFYDAQNQFIKLVPKADTSGAANSIEVAFYNDASQLKSDEYVMYGSYFEE